MNISTKKLLLFASGCTLSILVFIGAGCEQMPITESSTQSAPTSVIHIVMREVNPDDLSENSAGDRFDVYLSDTGSRGEISITVDDLEPDATTAYFYGDDAAKMEYMFTYPNTLTPEDREQLPADDPLQKAEHIIMALSMEKRPGGSSDQSLLELMLQPVLTIPKDQLHDDASTAYTITDNYKEYSYGGEEEPDIERRVTIDPVTNLPTRIELIDVSRQEPIETFAIDTYVVEDRSVYSDDFFNLEGWKKSLPGENHTIIEDDIN